MDVVTTIWQWMGRLAPVSVGDVLVGGLAALLVGALVTWPRRRPGLGPVQLGGTGPGPVTLADPLLLRLATWLFRPWLLALGGWYRPGQQRHKQDQLRWAGLEQTSLGAWMALRLLLLVWGALCGGALSWLLHWSLEVTGLVVLVSGLVFAWLPEAWVQDRLKRRDGVMLQQLVPWLREVASLLRSGTPTLIAMRQAATNLRQASGWQNLPAGLTDLFAEVERMQARMWTGQVSDAEALEELAARCPQADVNEALEELRLALVSGGNLAEALERGASIAQATIAVQLRSALARRQPEVTALTVVAAFVLYVGTIGSVIAIGIVQGLTGLH